MNPSNSRELSAFAADVLQGLSASPKHLSSKYFYDDEGTRLFQRIMDLPEYYLTDCEREIFEKQSDAIRRSFMNGDASVDLVELGAGDGSKTAILVSNFLKAGADFTYSPVDIAQEALDVLTERFSTEFPGLRIYPRKGDYFRILESLRSDSDKRKILLFLGSNIGNFAWDESVRFFSQLRRVMNAGDLLFIGFDLQKDPGVIVPAYDDPEGVTAEFNLNLLRRINRELAADFDTDKFLHYACYIPDEGSARSYLISREDQFVLIPALNKSFEFKAWEAIFMEISQKYTVEMIGKLAVQSGFAVKENFFDNRRYYCDSLWRLASE